MNNKALAGVIVIVVLAILTFGILTMPDQRSTGERVGDAIDALPEGPGEAAEQLKKRTPGERLGDAIEDATDRE